jgi:hypothetical protein
VEDKVGFQTQVRPNEHYIECDNPFDGAIENICEVLRRELKEDSEQKLKYIRRNTSVLSEDLVLVPKPPVISVSFSEWEENRSTIGQRYPQTVEYSIWIDIYYYYQEIKNKRAEKDVRMALWEIGRLLRRNSDFNGLSSKGALIQGGRPILRRRNDKLYEGGLIRLLVPVLDQTRRGVT